MSARPSPFDPNAQYLKAATGWEREQLSSMAKIIEAMSRQIHLLRTERQRLALRIGKRYQERETRKHERPFADPS